MAEKLTKKELLNLIDEKIQALNLLKSALQEDRSRKPDMIKDYTDKFYDILESEKK
jgi:2-keto-4-pentenoate hydratase